MAIPTYLAMTGAEFASTEVLPPHIGWMSCHFSPYGAGLSGLPSSLPPKSLLILNDWIPIAGHDPLRIADQLGQAVDALDCCGVLMDFQRPESEETAALSEHLVRVLSCPVAVSDLYAKALDCIIFLPPCPHHVPLSEYILPWQGRKLWLDLAINAETITLTEACSQIIPLPLGEMGSGGHTDSLLHCHYSIEVGEATARFTLWRTKEDMMAFSQEADRLGIIGLVGLYSELKNHNV